MSVDIKYLKTLGVSSGAYKKLFTDPKSYTGASNPIRKLVDTLSARRREGMDTCLREHRGYWAIDLAYEAPMNQSTVALVQALLSEKMDATKTKEALDSYGLKESDLFLNVEMPDGSKKQVLNPPVFNDILVPIVKAYVTIRCASLFNERDKSPLLTYTPLKQTDHNRVICDVVTDLVDTIATWYGYPAYLKQAILQMLKYGIVIAFAKEEWHCEKQVIDGEAKVQKEGLRYVMPHPTRMFYDLYHPLWTINTDTGCEYFGHWDIMRAGEVLDDRKYWNRNKISWGTNWFDSPYAGKYFQEVFPCQLKFPVMNDARRKREDKAAFYNTNDRDTAMFFTTIFWKLIPADWGLGDYKYPVWHRFVLAGDDTVIWAEPCAYIPAWFMGYDFDDQAGVASSLAAETVPWQIHAGNILSEMVRTAKKNLADFFAYDKNLVNKADLDALNSLGDRKYAGPQFLGFDSIKMQKAGLDWKQPFQRIDIGYHSIVELQQALNTALSIMERVLQITAQEAGTTAQHYQSAKEVAITQTSGSQRVKFTGSGIDDGIDALKRQIFDAAQAYRDDEVTAQVSADIPDLDKYLLEIGFKATQTGSRKVLVTGSKKTLKLEGFSRSNLGPVESADPAMAQVIFQTLGVVSQNPEIFQQVGAPRIIKLLEQAAKLAGAPRDFDLTAPAGDNGAPGNVAGQMAPVLQQLQQTIMEAVQKNVAAPIAQEVAKSEQEIATINDTLKKLEGIFAIAQQFTDKTNIMQREAQVQEQLDQAKFAAEQRRREEEHQLKLKQKQEESQLKLHTQATEAGVALKSKHEEAQLSLDSKAAETAAKIQDIQKQGTAKAKAAAKRPKPAPKA